MRDLWSLSRDQTPVPCIARWVLNHWTIREVPSLLLKAQLIQRFPPPPQIFFPYPCIQVITKSYPFYFFVSQSCLPLPLFVLVQSVTISFPRATAGTEQVTRTYSVSGPSAKWLEMDCLYIAHDIYSDKNTPHLLGWCAWSLRPYDSSSVKPSLTAHLAHCLLCSLSWADHLSTPQYPKHVSIFALSYFLALCLWGLFYWQLVRSSREKDCLIIFFISTSTIT